jgi:putative ABC transport system permease protein
MVSALDRKLLRDLSRLKGQVITIALVVACGVATFLTFVGAYRSLQAAEREFYTATRFGDVFASCKRAPLELEPSLAEMPGVAQVETRVVVEATLDMPATTEPIRGRLVSLPRAGAFLNAPLIREGRPIDPQRGDEALVSEPFAQAHRLRPGDAVRAIIDGRLHTFRVAGVALSPEYVFAIAPGAAMHDDARYGILWVDRDTLAAAYGMVGAFNDVSLRLAPGASEADVITRLDAALDPYGGFGAVGRDDQSSHHFVKNELDELETWATLLPAIFVGVAAFLLNVVLSRLIGTQREQIAALKAFGYSNLRVGVHYMQLIGAVIALGSVIGTALGWFLGAGLTGRYAVFFRFPGLEYLREPAVAIIGTGITLLAATVGGIGAVRAAVRLAPAEAMRPPAPTRFRRSLLEQLGIGGLLSNVGRIVVRNVSRRPLRAALSVVGIGFSGAIVADGLYFGDALDNLVAHQFGRVMREDMSVAFREPVDTSALRELAHVPGVLRVEATRMVPVRLRAEHRTRRLAILGIEPDAQLRRVLHGDGREVRLPAEGLVLTTWLGEHLGVREGDPITVEVLEGARVVRTTKVAALVDELFGLSVYMRFDALHRLLGEQESVSGALLSVDNRSMDATQASLKAMPGVRGVTKRTSILASFESMTGAWMALVSGILSAFAATIAFGVIYNTARINLAERERELASLRVLGFTIGEITTIFVGELAVLLVLGIPVAYGIAYAIAWLIMRMSAAEGYRFPIAFDPDTLGSAVLVVVVAGLVSALIVRRRLDHLDLVGVLKTRD